GHESVLEQQRLVCPAGLASLGSVTHEVRRYADDHLRVESRNQLEPLAVTVVVDRHVLRTVLPGLIVAKLLLETRSDGDDRGHPGRLRPRGGVRVPNPPRREPTPGGGAAGGRRGGPPGEQLARAEVGGRGTQVGGRGG